MGETRKVPGRQTLGFENPLYVFATAAEWSDEEQKWLLNEEAYGPFDAKHAQECVCMLAGQERIRGAVAEYRRPGGDV